MSDFNLAEGQVAERKQLITVAEWLEDGEQVREVLGNRTTESSIEYNLDVENETDILGNNHADVRSSKPQQDFDPFYIVGGSKLAAKLNNIRRRNAVSEYSQFNVYIITDFVGAEGEWEAEMHEGCTITPNSIGGDTRVNMPISVYYSNNITTGTIDKRGADFKFTADNAAE